MIAMPEPDRAVLGRRAEIVQALRRLVPGEGVIDQANELRAFESDGLTAYRQPPMVAVLPETTAQVVDVLRYCAANKVKVVPRGAGTSLSKARNSFGWSMTPSPGTRRRSAWTISARRPRTARSGSGMAIKARLQRQKPSQEQILSRGR